MVQQGTGGRFRIVFGFFSPRKSGEIFMNLQLLESFFPTPLKIARWWQLEYFLECSPRKSGEIEPIVDKYVCSTGLGRFNHQLDCVILSHTIIEHLPGSLPIHFCWCYLGFREGIECLLLRLLI